MKVETYDGSQERSVLIAMITSTEVLAQTFRIWKEDSLSSRWANLVASWCIEYFEQYHEAPNKDIEKKFLNFSQKNSDKETSLLLESFLESLSGEYERYKEKIHIEPTVDMVKEHFGKVQVKKLSDALQADLEVGDYVKGKQRILEYSPLEVTEKQVIDVFQDIDAIRSACDYSKSESLFTYPEGLGDFFGNSLRRGSFLGITAPDKAGKSMMLLDMAFRAVFQRCKVIYFEAGDLTQDQVMERFMVRASQRPARAGVIHYPVDMQPGETPSVVSEERDYPKELNFKYAWDACQKIMERKVKSKESYFKLHCSPCSSLRIKDIKTIIKDLGREGFHPDLVIVDYADLVSGPSHMKESRDQVDYVWKGLRSISQEQDCLVVTATQANALAYSADALTKKHFSNDKRKNAIVSGMIGLLSNDTDKEQGLSRLNWMVRRDAAYRESHICYLAGCLALANPAVRSIF